MAPFPPSCTAVLPMSAQDYFMERDSASFRALMSEVLDLGEVEWTESWKEGNKQYHKLCTRPDYERWVPKIGRKYVKPQDLDFYDTIEYDPEQLREPPYRLNVTSELRLLGDKLEAQRTIVIEAIDATHCRHSVEGQVKVRMFGIGRLAENGVIESTVKTFKQLPYVLERYLAVREELLKTEEGRAALMEGRPPHVGEIDVQMFAALQAPYPRATEDVSSAGPSTAHTSSSSEEEDDEDEAAEAAEANGGDTVSDELGTQASGRLLQRSQTVYLDPAPHLATSDSGLLEGGSLPKRQLQRMETMYFDVGEEIFDKDALWVPEEADAARSELPEKLQRIQSTRDALKRDRHKMRRVMHKIKKRSRHFIVSELGIEPDRRAGAPHRREADPEAARTQGNWNSQGKAWREFWRSVKVQAAPVPSMSGRLLQLITFGQATGWVNMHLHSKDDSVSIATDPGDLSEGDADTPSAPASVFSQEPLPPEGVQAGRKPRRKSKLLSRLKDQLKLN